MKIIRHDQNHIAVHSNPVWMWIMGLVFVAFAVVGVLFLGSQSTFTCVRSEGACNFEQKTLLNTKTRPIPLEQLISAEIYTSTDSDGSDTYKVVLNTTNGTIPLTSYSSSGYKSHQRIADQINEFLANTGTSSLEVRQDSRMLLYILSAVFGGIGLLMVLLTSRVAIDLDRTKGLAIIRRTSLITSSTDEILLGDLAGAEVESSRGRDGTTYRVALVQRSGQRTPLTSYYSSGFKGKQDLADEINRFLKGV